MRLKLMIIIAFSFCLVNGQDIDLIWKARALKASETLDSLVKEMKRNDSKALRYNIMLETAYFCIISYPEVAVKKTPKLIAYHLFLNFGDDGRLDVAYLYEPKTMDYLGVRIDALPEKCGVVLNPAEDFKNHFGIVNNFDSEPMILFNQIDPFAARIVN